VVADLPLSPSDNSQAADAIWRVLPQAIKNLPGPIRHRAENALDGFARARKLYPLDREIASFRAITAAEEAASALIRSLQLRKYPDADQIKLWMHPHKAAVYFFLRAVHHEVFRNKVVTMNVTLSADPPKLTIALPIRQFGQPPPDMEDYQIVLTDPLGMVGSRPGITEDDYFDAAVQKVAGSRRVDKLIAKEANGRNRILYAHDTGLPRSQATLEGIESRERGAKLCIILAIAIMQVDHHQGMVLQCLRGFLKVIGRADVQRPRLAGDELGLITQGDGDL
jgi:hypothetical protein